jgi:RNA polymerase primary sigma factor
MKSAIRRWDRSAPVLQIYLKDINETPLLSAQDERDLAGRVAAGDPLARDHFVRANLRLVVNIAQRYLGRGLPLEDLIAEGNLGLMRAVEGFDPATNVRFATYASYWIKQSIRGALIKYGKPIRLPYYMVMQLNKWRRASIAMAAKLGRAPTPEEVGRALKLRRKQFTNVVQALRIVGLIACSADGPCGNDELRDYIADERIIPVEEQAIVAEATERRIPWMLARLDEREFAVIRLRFGLGEGAPMTLNEVGKALGGYSRDRVRQLERKALAKLTAAAV